MSLTVVPVNVTSSPASAGSLTVVPVSVTSVPAGVTPPPGTGNEQLQVYYGVPSLDTVYFVITATDNAWDGFAFEPMTVSGWPSYAIPGVNAAGVSLYFADFPTAIDPGEYAVYAYLRAGSVPAPSDTLVGSGTGSWDGETFGEITGPGGSGPPLPAPATVPNPDETVFTLTQGGVVARPSVAAGLDLRLASVLRNAGLALAYTSSDTLEAVVWRGRGEAVLVRPTVAWIDPALGSFSLSLVGNQTAGFDPGQYRMQVLVTSAALGLTSLAYDGVLVILEVPGTVSARSPYVTYKDMEFWYPQVGYLKRLREDDTGFLQQRVNASDEFDIDLIKRYKPRPGFVKIRSNAFDPVIGFDVAKPNAVAPSKKALTAAIEAGGVIVNRNVNEIVCRRALADILDRQEMIGNNTYRAEAQAMRDRAQYLWDLFEIPVDSSVPPDGVADWLIHTDATILTPGTAP